MSDYQLKDDLAQAICFFVPGLSHVRLPDSLADVS
jgi:hypothetical protein